jgi:hypothetical protein
MSLPVTEQMTLITRSVQEFRNALEHSDLAFLPTLANFPKVHAAMHLYSWVDFYATLGLATSITFAAKCFAMVENKLTPGFSEAGSLST